MTRWPIACLCTHMGTRLLRLMRVQRALHATVMHGKPREACAANLTSTVV